MNYHLSLCDRLFFLPNGVRTWPKCAFNKLRLNVSEVHDQNAACEGSAKVYFSPSSNILQSRSHQEKTIRFSHAFFHQVSHILQS